MFVCVIMSVCVLCVYMYVLVSYCNIPLCLYMFLCVLSVCVILGFFLFCSEMSICACVCTLVYATLPHVVYLCVFLYMHVVVFYKKKIKNLTGPIV